MRRGDVWWAELAAPAGPRPVVIVSRSEACVVRSAVTVAPVTSRIRELPVEVPLGADDGLPKAYVVNCDSLATVPKARLSRRIAVLHPAKIVDLNRALKFALGLS
jgi:mRNA interferase MazF